MFKVKFEKSNIKKSFDVKNLIVIHYCYLSLYKDIWVFTSSHLGNCKCQ
jgi:hypothetical protein